MTDDFSPVLSDLEYNFNQEDEADLYNKVADKILEATDYYTKQSGLVICTDKSEAEVAKNILEKDYSVTIKPLGDTDYDLQYHVMFSRLEEEYQDLEFISNKGSKGTLIGDIGGVAESYENPEEETNCPYCGGKLEFYGGQGNYWMYKCDECGKWVFLNKDNNFKSEAEVEQEFITEDSDDSFRSAQDYYDSLTTNEQQEEIDNLTSALQNLGIDYVEVRQLIPTKDSNYNISINCLIKNSDITLGEYESSISYTLIDFGANDVDLKVSEINTPKYKFKIWGFCEIDGMTLHEDTKKKSNGKWVNKGEDGEHGEFKTKKEADAQRRAMFANGWHEDLNEAEIHDDLNPDLWEDGELKSEVKNKLLEIAKKFEDNLKENDIKLDIKDIVIVGSNSQYNYTDKSDIDLHLLVDLSVYPNQEELAAKLYDARRSLWNDKYDPTIYGHQVEVYVEPYQEPSVEEELNEAISKGIYSLYNGWLSKPEKEEIDLPDISADFESWVKKAELCDTVEDIDNYLDEIYQIRQDGLLSNGEFSEGNLLFKELRDNNILDNLKDKKINLLNQEMSL